MSSNNTKLLANGIVNFLDSQIHSSSLNTEAIESIEVAKQCILDAFGLEEDSVIAGHDFNKISLLQILDLYKSGKITETSQSSAPSTNDQDSSKNNKALAEEFKAKGNAFMSSKDYSDAIEEYSKAIDIDSTNAIYYANRSAAECQLGNMENALNDAQMAIDIDPTYSKAYSRLGHAHYGLGEFSEAADAYRNALKYDPNNQSTKAFLESSEAKLQQAGKSRDVGQGNKNPLGSGMPDLSALLSNPALASMAQNLMGSGAMDQILKNPEMAKMAESFKKTGKMPSMDSLMNTPGLAEMAGKFSGAGGSPAPAPAQENSNPSQNPDFLNDLMKNPDIMKM
ncbi:Small glutamine-rich tetratricopeptide repeat-containing protein 2 [Smittium culicis]|uniref:Small glutamine-rich tetratricopeptide repeat-containing protein 2 n=2 Tax=Smittium culicis TaxID=133412 RepID=A0A1R1XS83_9FUNG|nr:Small glutamine-rich tetratricopeptide repeat-containing protein 2 [Smittium culicis]